jgi:hypothetical protein
MLTSTITTGSTYYQIQLQPITPVEVMTPWGRMELPRDDRTYMALRMAVGIRMDEWDAMTPRQRAEHSAAADWFWRMCDQAKLERATLDNRSG